MKKLLSGIALASLLATTAMANNSGHNVIVGLGVGLQSLTTNVKQSWSQGVGQFLENYDAAENRFAGGAFLGYRTSIGSFLGGFEVDATTPADYQNDNTNNGQTSSIKVKAGMAFGGSVLLGAHVTDTAYAAIRLGGEYRKFTIDPRLGSQLVPANGTGNKRSIKGLSFVPGVLVGTSFNGCWDLSADYRVNFGKKKTFGTIAANSLHQKIKQTSQTFMLKLGYKFGI